MEEDLNENDLEERLYAMLHYGDETQANDKVDTNNDDFLRTIENAPRSTVRRYWRTSTDETISNQKVNTSRENPSSINNNVPNTDTKIDEKQNVVATIKPSDLSLFQSPVPKNVKKTIEILENDCGNVVELDSSDEDEVIEIALPPKPTITIESSDDEELKVVAHQHSLIKKINTIEQSNKKPDRSERDVSASPVPSVVSSVSDEFIRGDCIALKISSKHPDNPSFDFSLHGSDLLDHSTPSKKKKKKKSKERSTSTPLVTTTQDKSSSNIIEECFATPKSKAKNKRQKNKSHVAEKSVINADLYDSDSNHSCDNKRNKNSYSVTEKSVPSLDVYESDSSQSETNKEMTSDTSTPTKLINATSKNVDEIVENDVSTNSIQKSTTKTPKSKDSTSMLINNSVIAKLSEIITIDEPEIHENIIMANVSGFTESKEYENETINVDEQEVPKLGSTNVPAILNEDLDFDNLKGNNRMCKRRKYSLTALRAEMEKFYNESWGGENFNHREIQKYMSRDKSLWVIDPKDRMPAQYRKKSVSCNYCNRPGHRDDMCQLKPPVCYMCGSTGHYEPRCPKKICVNCGSPNYMYSSMCRNCATWGRIRCAECGQCGHPASHCPDIWRRYHNTIDINVPLEENRQMKNHYQLFCSGCTRRGHLVHTCRISLPFSGLPINSPYVYRYTPVYFSAPIENKISKSINPPIYEVKQPKIFNQDSTFRSERNKRQSKSPTVHENHINKKRNVSDSNDETSPNEQKKKSQQNKEVTEDVVLKSNETTGFDFDKAPDFIPLNSSNHDKKGQMIQDNEVSDSSDIITSARIFITKELLDKLKSREGDEWLREMSEKHNVVLQHADSDLFLGVKGKAVDQEAFQNELRSWTKEKSKKDSKSDSEGDVLQESDIDPSMSINIPKNRNNVLRKLSRAFESLKQDIGDPSVLYKELTYLQDTQLRLLRQKVISPKKISNNRYNINEMLKKLNMILLGQAGLADGSKHLSELQSLQEKLTSFRQKNIPLCLRNEIGEHYHCIFTAMPRDDYVDLLNKYYISKNGSDVMKKKENFRLMKPIHRNKPMRVKKHMPMKKFRGIAPQPKNLDNDYITVGSALSDKKVPRPPLVEKTMNKLVFYHKRLMHTRPVDIVLKKTRLELVRRLHSRISELGRNTVVSSKSLKKMKKLQQQAQLFLTNV